MTFESSSSSTMLVFGRRNEEEDHMNQLFDVYKQDAVVVSPVQPPRAPLRKRKNPTADADAEVIALSPTSLMTKNRFVCDVCHKGFPREQNLQLHKRGHNLPWKLTSNDKLKRKVYLCPEPSCIHHHPSHALGDLTGIKKHYSRKHVTERNHKCEKCTKTYAVESDLKVHLKVCGKKEDRYHSDTCFSRHDNFLVHGAFCEAPTKDTAIKHPPTISDMGVNSFKIYGNNNNNNNNQTNQMSVSLPQLDFQVLSSHNLANADPTIITRVSQSGRKLLNNLMIRPSMNLNNYKPPPTFFMPNLGQQKQYIYQQKIDPWIFTNLVNNTTVHNKTGMYNPNFMGNDKNYGSGGGSNLFTCDSITSDGSTSIYLSPHTGTMASPFATGLLQTTALIGSLSSNYNANNFLLGYASSPSSGTTFCSTRPENEGLLFGRKHFGITDSNGYYSNMNGLQNSFGSSGGRPFIFNHHVGLTYEQEENFLNGLDNGGRAYDDGKNTFNSEEQQLPNTFSNMGFQQYNGMTFTRDFLGVGGEMGNIINNGTPSSFGGQNIW